MAAQLWWSQLIKCTQNRCFIPCRVVTKISSCQVNTTSRRGIKPARDFFWFYFSSIFLWKSEPGAKFVVAWENPWSPPLNDSPGPGHSLIRNLSFCGSFRRNGEECVQMFISHHVWTNVCVFNNKFTMYCTRGITLTVSLETRINWWKHKLLHLPYSWVWCWQSRWMNQQPMQYAAQRLPSMPL